MNKKHKGAKILLLSLLTLSVLLLFSVLGISVYAARSVDFGKDEALFSASKSENITRFYYDKSSYCGKIPEKYEPCEFECISSALTKKAWYSYGEISDVLKKAFIATEDREFFEHHGINIKRTFAALGNYIFHFGSDFGGSTITQQVIKNISGDNEHTARRKLNEIIRAYHLEYTHSKEEIFELYLNIIPLGEGIAGVGLAAMTYFDKEPNELTISEAATLVALTNAPTRYNPYTNYTACLEKRNVIISSMYECGFISEEERDIAQAQEIVLAERKSAERAVNSWFAEAVCNELTKDLMKKYGYSYDTARVLVTRGGLSVYTTLDYDAHNAITAYFENESNFPEEIKNGLDYSMVICDSESADLRAIVGSVGKKSGNFIINNATLPKPPASTLKPLALYAPLINSGRITWSTVFDDVPVSFKQNGDGEYTEYPRNSPGVYDGLIHVANALAYSKNTVAVRLYNILGKEKIYNHLKNDYGFEKIVKDGAKNDMAPSPLALGQLTYGISLKALTEAYTAFPAEGRLYKCRSYVLCFDGEGEKILEKSAEYKQIYTPECARITNQLLCGVTGFGTARSVTLKNIVDIAGKTGTSAGSCDKLFVGYTPYYTAGVWSGYASVGKSVGNYVQSHIKVWDDVMKLIHEKRLSYDEDIRSFSTEGLVRASFCIDSGKTHCDRCMKDPRGERISYGYFLRGTEPQELCDRHVLCDYDVFLRGVAVNPTYRGFIREVALLDIPDRAFPVQIYVTDAEYVYRRVDDELGYGTDASEPYFVYALPEGEYAGISKSKKQFNSSNIQPSRVY